MDVGISVIRFNYLLWYLVGARANSDVFGDGYCNGWGDFVDFRSYNFVHSDVGIGNIGIDSRTGNLLGSGMGYEFLHNREAVKRQYEYETGEPYEEEGKTYIMHKGIRVEADE